MFLVINIVFLLSLNLGTNCENDDSENLREHQSEDKDRHLTSHLTNIVDLEGQGLRHIEKHLQLQDEDGENSHRFSDEIKAIEEGDDTKGMFYFFKLHDFDKNNKLDGLELYIALTDHREKNSEEEVLEEEIESLIDNLLQEHDFSKDGYLEFAELMNTGPDSIWNKLGKI